MYEIDPITGPHVLRAFQMIDEGMMQMDVLAYFNQLGLKTSQGNPFTKSSFRTMWRNRKYLGEYRYRDIVIPNIIPQLIPDDLFQRVNARIDKNKFTNGGRARSMTEFLLTGKLICGHCGKPMIGCSGTGKSGAIHYYYSCTTRRREHNCDKSNERKEALEIAIVRETIQHVLQPVVLSSLIDHALAILEKEVLEDPILRTLEAEKKTVETSLRNLMRAIEDGLYTPTTKKRLDELEQQQADIASKIAVQKASHPVVTREHLQYFLESFRDGDVNNPDHRCRVIDALVHSVTVSDITSDDDGSKPMRRLQIMYNLTQNNTSSIDLASLDCSTAVEVLPPCRLALCLAAFIMFQPGAILIYNSYTICAL